MENLENLSYKDLKEMAKSYGINPTQKKTILIDLINEKISNVTDEEWEPEPPADAHMYDIEVPKPTFIPAQIPETVKELLFKEELDKQRKRGKLLEWEFEELIYEPIISKVMKDIDVRKLYNAYIASDCGADDKVVINWVLRKIF